MMDPYTAHIIARTEHELMTRSLPDISEYNGVNDAGKAEWLSKRMGGLLQRVGRRITSLGERVAHEQSRGLAAQLVGEGVSVG